MQWSLEIHDHNKNYFFTFNRFIFPRQFYNRRDFNSSKVSNNSHNSWKKGKIISKASKNLLISKEAYLTFITIGCHWGCLFSLSIVYNIRGIFLAWENSLPKIPSTREFIDFLFQAFFHSFKYHRENEWMAATIKFFI